MVNHLSYRLALREHLRDIVGLPDVAWENKEFQPEIGTEYIREEYVPGPMSRITASYSGAVLEVLPMYVLRLAFPIGDSVTNISDLADDILTQFAPGTQITASNGDVLHVRGDVAPFAGQILRIDSWAEQSVTIPLRVRTTNSN